MLKKRKSIVIDGKLYYYSQVVMLPTNQKATKESIILHKNNFLTFKSLQTEKDVLIYNDKHFGDDGSRVQHLYILSDEEVREGDYHIYRGQVRKYPHSTPWSEKGRIIATTDSSIACIKDTLSIPQRKGLTNHYPTEKWILPQPSQSFISKFIEKYNKGEHITEVLIEYKQETLITDDGDIGYCYTNDGKQGIYKLKINPKDNTITIKPCKTNWNREEHNNISSKFLV